MFSERRAGNKDPEQFVLRDPEGQPLTESFLLEVESPGIRSFEPAVSQAVKNLILGQKPEEPKFT